MDVVTIMTRILLATVHGDDASLAKELPAKEER